MSKILSAIYIITRLKRNCVNANEGAGACHMEIIQIIPSLSGKKNVPLVSAYCYKVSMFEKLTLQSIFLVPGI